MAGAVRLRLPPAPSFLPSPHAPASARLKSPTQGRSETLAPDSSPLLLSSLRCTRVTECAAAMVTTTVRRSGAHELSAGGAARCERRACGGTGAPKRGLGVQARARKDGACAGARGRCCMLPGGGCTASLCLDVLRWFRAPIRVIGLDEFCDFGTVRDLPAPPPLTTGEVACHRHCAPVVST